MAKHRPTRIHRHVYEAELERLQVELARMQTWVRDEGQRVVVLFEGRDAAGKGGTIKRITEPLNTRFARVAALPAPTDRETTQWYFQRYIAQLPAAGEIVLFDRSWYNRAGVERVLGFCTPEQYRLFMRQVPQFERMLIDDGILFTKYWFSVSDDEQRRRFQDRIDDPTKRWKLSPMDLKSRSHYVDYSRAKDEMFEQTDLPGTDGSWSKPTTSAAPGSTASPTCCLASHGRIAPRRPRPSFRRASPTAATYDRPGAPRGMCPITPPSSNSSTATMGNRQ